jgi:acyl carrier protein phosphodiesterase
MNYLAHLFLSCDADEHIVGNFIADSIRTKDLLGFSKGIISGIDLHKSIDIFTDTHPTISQSNRRLHKYHGKYSPIIIDIWFDHLLTRHWDKYSDESLRDFADRMYVILEKNIGLMPPKMQTNLPKMNADDWLINYSNLDGMRRTFERFKHRLSRPELLKDVIENLNRLDMELETDFLLFFPQLIKHIQAKHH